MINLVLVKLMTVLPYLIELFGNNIANFNEYTRFVVTYLCSSGDELCNLLMQVFVTYSDCSLDKDHFTRYIDMLKNKYNDRTLNL